MTPTQLSQVRRLLCALQTHIRATLIRARRRHARDFMKIAGVTAADTIYQIDRLSEDAILGWLRTHWPAKWPVEIVMEGLGDNDSVTIPRGTPVELTVFKCILDPIDGTRGLMYDKRAAWVLAGVAPQRGARTHLGEIVVAAMTELPTSKQGRADQFSAIRGGGVVAESIDLRTGRRSKLCPQRSQAQNFQHGFASFARFFTTGKTLTSQIEEAFWAQLHDGLPERTPLVFDDQYISTGGQIAELLTGHDRMTVDIRPLVFAALKQTSALVCHPYDICTELILREAGGVIEDPAGRPLQAPLDTTTPVAWVGWANSSLADLARPALRAAIDTFVGKSRPARHRGIDDL